MEVRLGGIYALERISKDSPKDYWTIMEVLTAYVRERAPWPPKTQPENQETAPRESPAAEIDREPPPPKPPTDIQAILTVIARRAHFYGKGEDYSLDFSNTDLQGARLIKMHLEMAHFKKANLKSAEFDEVYLQGAAFHHVNLQGAKFWDANLKGTVLFGANLEGAHLEGADLTSASGLTREQLKSAASYENALLPDDLQDPAPKPPAPDTPDDS